MHIAHRAEYMRGWGQGRADMTSGQDYAPGGGATGSQGERDAYSLGYEGGWAEADPCANGTCGHPAHRVFRFAVYERGEVVARNLDLADAEAMAGRLAGEGRDVYYAISHTAGL